MYMNHTGGCPGADMTWETEGNKYGVHSISYSFYNHVQEGENQVKLTQEELNEGWSHILTADKTLERTVTQLVMPYERNLLSRNWFQVKNATSVYAIARLLGKSMLYGGTSWTVQMAIDEQKPVFVYEQDDNVWYQFSYGTNEFSVFGDIAPTLTTDFAGIGNRYITLKSIDAIKDAYERTFHDR